MIGGQADILPLIPVYVFSITLITKPCFAVSIFSVKLPNIIGGFRGGDGMVVGIITTYAISAYHNLCCEFESRSCELYSIQHHVIKFVSELLQVGDLLRVLRFPPPIKLTATI